MNKKIIKYLIWTIIIAAVLILMPLKQAKAYDTTVYYSEFKTSKNLFCLNKGFPFTVKETYSVSGGVDKDTVKFVFAEDVANGIKLENVLEYIITESVKGTRYGKRTQVNNYTPQNAIWKLASGAEAVSDIEADKLIAEAKAYSIFKEKGLFNNIPTIEKNTNNTNNTIIIKHYRTFSEYNGASAEYSNLLFDTIVVENSNNISEPYKISNNLYAITYTINSNAVEINVSFKYETKRTSNFETYKAKPGNSVHYILYPNGTGPDLVEYWKIGDCYYHCNCGNGEYRKICKEIDIYDKIKESCNIDVENIKDYIVDERLLKNSGYTFYWCENTACKYLGVSENEIINFEIQWLTSDIIATCNEQGYTREKKSDTYYPQNLLYGTGDVYTTDGGGRITFIQPVTLNFKKQDFNGNSVNGATINISGVNNVGSLSANSITIGSDKEVEVTPANGNSGTFKIKLTENAPTGYKPISTRYLKVGYNNGSVTGITAYIDEAMTIEDSTYISTSESTTTIKNKPKVDLIINKTDPLIGPLANARFKIELTNVESMEKYEIPQIKDGEEQNSPTMVYVKTDENGQIKLTGIVPTGGKEGTITATITEVEVPTANGYYYKLLENPITVTMTYDNGSWSETGVGSISGNILTVEIQNQPYIDLSGNVWQDGQLGEKIISGPDGIKNEFYKYEKVGEGQGNYTATYESDRKVTFKYVGEGKGNYTRITISEGFLDGVLVELYNVDATGNITGGRVAFDRTENGGKYEFKEIPKTDNGYKVVFKYDGINYEATAQNVGNDEKIDSDVQEQNRNTVGNINNISKDLANNEVPLGYKKNEPILNVNMDGTNPANNNAIDFQVEAHTGVYKNSDSDITCGLVKREFDLSIGTDIKSAKLTINDKTTEYIYNQVTNVDLDDIDLDKILNNNSSTAEGIIYNLYLYHSDYNYRISDYKTDIEGENKNTFINNMAYNDNKKCDKFDNLKALEAYVTYSVTLKNQTTHNARVDEFVYYYDEAYIPQFSIGDIINGYRVESIESNKIIFKVVDNTKFNLTNPNYRVEIDLTFKINKDSEGYLVVGKKATNVAEITRYSTDEGGLIDKDSAPGNANVTFKDGTPTVKAENYEDDTDEAKGLNIVLRTDETRIITGTVIEDLDKDGKLEDNEPKVNGVVVQLIEIKEDKEKDGQYYEYIWQETQTGSNVVLATPRNGFSNEKYQYTNNVTEDGKFEFKDFIPGNYIIRYIYGDVVRTGGEYKEIQQKYNGQDYKSTVDSKYQEECYNNAGYTVGDSVARDNEARRLEVMSHSTIVNTEMVEKENKYLEDNNRNEDWRYHFTWMAAETSIIKMQVDSEIKSETSDYSKVSYNYTIDDENKVIFDNMDFGLTLRPQTNIVLEKHITSLKITPSGTGVLPIVDAKARNIEEIVNGEEVQVKGITTGLATIKSTAENRGFWQVATDVEELMQGAELEVEYTYVLRNDSEPDYLSSELVNEYETNTNGYSAYLSNIVIEGQGNLKNKTKGKTHTYGTYLGEYYYTGNKGANDTLVTSRIEKFEEALNNDLAFNESDATSFKVTQEDINKKVYGVNKAEGTKEVQIDTIVQNKTVTPFLVPALGNPYKTTTETEKGTADWSRTLKLTTTLSTVAGGELGANLPSYIAEILQYSNAAGRIDMNARVNNLSYVHSDDSDMTMASDNEHDEFWAESIIITKPTGEDKVTPLQIALMAVSAIATLGVGIVLIKKFVLNK